MGLTVLCTSSPSPLDILIFRGFGRELQGCLRFELNHYSSYLCCSENERAGHKRLLRAEARPGLPRAQCGLLAAAPGRGTEQFRPKPCPTLPPPGAAELMLKLKFGYLVRRTDLFEKTQMLGKIEGGRRRR